MRKTWKILVAAAGASSLMVLVAAPASANDIEVYNSGASGSIEFVDHGPGRPGGGSNDDYFWVHDYESDGHGVKAWVWLDGRLIGSKYNGSGRDAPPVFWDPVQITGTNFIHTIGMKVCNVDGNSDPTPFNCHSTSHEEVG
jgi:hypothetical protein